MMSGRVSVVIVAISAAAIAACSPASESPSPLDSERIRELLENAPPIEEVLPDSYEWTATGFDQTVSYCTDVSVGTAAGCGAVVADLRGAGCLPVEARYVMARWFGKIGSPPPATGAGLAMLIREEC